MTVHPHRALGRRTPQQAYDARPKATSTATPLDDTHYRIRHDTIDDSGVFTLRHNSRLHHIGIGRRHAGTHILVLVHDLHIRVLNTDGELLRELQLNAPALGPGGGQRPKAASSWSSRATSDSSV